MKNLRDLMGSDALPAPGLVRWAAVLLSLSILTYLISLSASQAFLAASGLIYVIHLLHQGPGADVPLRSRAPWGVAYHLLLDHRRVSFPPLKVPLALFCLLSVLSVLWAADSGAGWFAIRKLVLFLIWLLALNLVKTAQHLRWLLQAWFVESAVAGVVAAAQFVIQYRAVSAGHPGHVYDYMTSLRIHGFMGHWMNFGGQQMLVFSVLLAFLLSGLGARDSAPDPRCQTPGPQSPTPNPQSRIWWLVLSIVALSIVLNFTRGVWLGCFVATLYLVARWRARWLWVLPVLVAVVYVASPSLVRRRVWLALHPTQDPSLAIRLEMWRVGLRMIRAHPWLGVGPNNIEREYLVYLPPGETPIVGYHSHLHNNLLQFGAERGLPCLAAWVWLMAALGWQAARIRRKLIRQPTDWVADAALAAWLALLFEGCFEFNFGTSPVLMVFLFVTSLPFVAEQIECRKGGGRNTMSTVDS